MAKIIYYKKLVPNCDFFGPAANNIVRKQFNQTMHSAGNPAIFLEVVNAHKGIVYKIAHAYCSSTEDRKDLVQEIIFQLWKSYHKYDAQYKYSTWIYRIALNTAISFYRKEKTRREINYPFSGDLLVGPDTAYNPEKDEQLAMLQQFIASLKDLDKALVLLYLEEKSLQEIAAIMDLSVTNVATKISRIKKQLQQRFLITKNE